MKRLMEGLERVLKVSLTILLGLVFVDLILQVGSRYIFQKSLIWTEEISRFGMIWLVFLGAAQAVRTGGHFAVELVLNRLPARGRRLWELILHMMAGLFILVLLNRGINFSQLGLRAHSPTLGISLAWVYAAVPVGAAFMLAFVVERLWNLLALSSRR